MSWGPGDRPAGFYERPGQYPRHPVAITLQGLRELGERDLRGATQQLVAKGWRIDSADSRSTSLSRPSYWLPVWATVLLVLGTCGVWIVPAAWLQGSRRRDTIVLALDRHYMLQETRTRGW